MARRGRTLAFVEVKARGDDLGAAMALDRSRLRRVAVAAERLAPRYASLPNIMKAKSKPLAQKTPADYGVDTAPRLETLKVVEPSKRTAGVKVGSVDELVEKLKSIGAVG